MGGHCPGFPSVENVLRGVPLADSPTCHTFRIHSRIPAKTHSPPGSSHQWQHGRGNRTGSFYLTQKFSDGQSSDGLPIGLAKIFSELTSVWGSSYPVLLPSLPFLRSQTWIALWRPFPPTSPVPSPFILHRCLISLVSASLRTWSDMLSHQDLAQALLPRVWGTCLPPRSMPSLGSQATLWPPQPEPYYSVILINFLTLSPSNWVLQGEEIFLLISEFRVYDKIPGV